MWNIYQFSIAEIPFKKKKRLNMANSWQIILCQDICLVLKLRRKVCGKKGREKATYCSLGNTFRMTQTPSLVSTSEDPEAQRGLCEATRLVTSAGGLGHRPPWVQLVLCQLGCVGLISLISLTSPQSPPASLLSNHFISFSFYLWGSLTQGTTSYQISWLASNCQQQAALALVCYLSDFLFHQLFVSLIHLKLCVECRRVGDI